MTCNFYKDKKITAFVCSRNKLTQEEIEEDMKKALKFMEELKQKRIRENLKKNRKTNE